MQNLNKYNMCHTNQHSKCAKKRSEEDEDEDEQQQQQHQSSNNNNNNNNNNTNNSNHDATSSSSKTKFASNMVLPVFAATAINTIMMFAYYVMGTNSFPAPLVSLRTWAFYSAETVPRKCWRRNMLTMPATATRMRIWRKA